MSYKNLRVSYVYRVSSFSVYMDQNTGGSQSLCLFKEVSCFLHKDESIRTTKFFREASRLRVVFLFPSEWPRCSLDVSKLHEDQEIWKSFENYKVSHKAEIKHHYWLCWIWCWYWPLSRDPGFREMECSWPRFFLHDPFLFLYTVKNTAAQRRGLLVFLIFRAWKQQAIF